jgi:hypothetical protein
LCVIGQLQLTTRHPTPPDDETALRQVGRVKRQQTLSCLRRISVKFDTEDVYKNVQNTQIQLKSGKNIGNFT